MNKKKIYPQWFLILPLALYIIFFLLPSIMGVAYSFTDWNSRSVLNGIHFVGLDNFKEIFTSNKDYLSGIGNTLKFTIISNIVKLIPALLIAIMLQEGLKGKGLYRTLLYLPSILPFVIIGLVFKSILNYNNGLLNAILDGLHLGILKQKWLSDLGVVWKSIYGVDAWRGIGIAKWEQKDYKGARNAFRKALDNNAEKTGTIYNLIGNCDLKLGKAKEALNYYNLGLEQDDVSKKMKKEMKYNIIVAYEKMEDWESAEVKLEEYLESYPNDKAAKKEAEFLETR